MGSRTKIWLALASIFIGTGLACGNAAANPAGVTYLATVKTSFGTTFKDCYAFDTNGTLTVGGLGALTYQLLAFGSSPGRFESVAPVSLATEFGFDIAFSGYAFGTAKGGYLKAVGLDEGGDSYEIHGKPVASCGLAQQIPGALYRHP